MKPGQPKIRTQPPSNSSQQDALARLEKLNEWTEQPARDAAASLTDDKTPVNDEEPTVDRPQSLKKGRVVAYPWQDVSEGAERQLNVKVPTELHLKLKWLGDTTYGTNMTQIVLDSLTDTVKRMLKERGIK